MRTGNDLAELSSILFFVAFCLRVYVTIEQPLCSCLPLFGSMKLVLYFTSSRRYVTYMGTLVDAMIWSIFYFVFFWGYFSVVGPNAISHCQIKKVKALLVVHHPSHCNYGALGKGLVRCSGSAHLCQMLTV